MKTRHVSLLALTFGVLLTAGCATSRSGIYDRSQAGRTMRIETGDVVATSDTAISGTQGPIGLSGGGLVGHAVGAVGGAIAGTVTEEHLTRRPAQEVTVKLSTGETVLVVQEIQRGGPYVTGERVQVLSSGAGTTLRRL
jgi:outer membrane lipoprotein SlyB